MATGYVLYNKKAGDADSSHRIRELEKLVEGELKFINVLDVSDYKVFITGLEKDDYIIIAGGDGTLNHFINDTEGINIECDVLYFPSGTGNDFAFDVGFSKYSKPFSIRKYLRDLPYVTVNGKSYRFINGVGYGIDGYCCEVGDKLKELSQQKKVNYTAIAIKGLLFHYKPTNARVTVDGKTYTYKKVWLAPTMHGRFYGGGMMPTPSQMRNNENGILSVLVFHGSGKLKTLMVFPSLFKGEHLKYKKIAELLSGHEITVEFDRPVALQIDGETITGVSSYTASAAKINDKNELEQLLHNK